LEPKYSKYSVNKIYSLLIAEWGTLLVAQLVEALRYKPEGRGIDSRWCHWNFSLT
jgi:hypothetical protein